GAGWGRGGGKASKPRVPLLARGAAGSRRRRTVEGRRDADPADRAADGGRRPLDAPGEPHVGGAARPGGGRRHGARGGDRRGDAAGGGGGEAGDRAERRGRRRRGAVGG